MYIARMLEERFGHKVKGVAAIWPEDGKSEVELLDSLIEYVKTLHGIVLTTVVG